MSTLWPTINKSALKGCSSFSICTTSKYGRSLYRWNPPGVSASAAGKDSLSLRQALRCVSLYTLFTEGLGRQHSCQLHLLLGGLSQACSLRHSHLVNSLDKRGRPSWGEVCFKVTEGLQDLFRLYKQLILCVLTLLLQLVRILAAAAFEFCFALRLAAAGSTALFLPKTFMAQLVACEKENWPSQVRQERSLLLHGGQKAQLPDFGPKYL